VKEYYSEDSTLDKVSRAKSEANALLRKAKTTVEKQYSDVARALRYAADTPVIDESSAIRDLLLRIAPSVLEEFDATTSEIELSAIAGRYIREQGRLFKFTNVSPERTEPTIQVDILSPILDVTGFPFELPKSCDVRQEIRKKIQRT